MSSSGVFSLFCRVPFVLAAFMYASDATFFPPLSTRPCPSPLPPPKNYTTTFYLQVIITNGTNNDIANTFPVSGIEGKLFGIQQFGTLYAFEVNITTTPGQNSTVIGKEYGTAAVVDLNGFVFEVCSTYVFTSGEFAGSTLTRLGSVNLMQQVNYNPIVGGTNALTNAIGYIVYNITIVQPPFFLQQATVNFEIAA